MESINIDSLVIGGGCIGLSVAKFISEKNNSLFLIEKNQTLGEETSSRNSSVLHAGFYYPLGTYKSQFCNSGNKMLYKYLSENNIFFEQCGKLVISNDNNLTLFEKYIENAKAINASPLEILSRKSIQELEPEINANYALFSPESGYFDVSGYLSCLENDVISNGAIISKRTELLSCQKTRIGFISKLKTDHDVFEVKSKNIYFCVGLNSKNFSNIFPSLDVNLRQMTYCKGQYFKYSGKSSIRHLIYPKPDRNGHGIHLGFDIDGSIRFGPDAVYIDGIDYKFDPTVKKSFLKSINSYLSISSTELAPDYVGIRPRLVPDKSGISDFQIIHEATKSSSLVIAHGIESPGLTSSLAIGQYIAEL